MAKLNNPLIDTITETLHKRILSGEYKGGYKLSENMISREFNCSRTPVREAFKRLDMDNIVETLPHSGTYVKSVSKEENTEIMEVRSYLESLAFRLCVEKNVNVDKLEELEKRMESIMSEEKIDFISYGKVHFAFHRTLVEKAGNTLLLELYNRLNLNVSQKIIYAEMNEEEIKETAEEHKEIIRLLKEKKKEEGERFMVSHLWSKRDRIIWTD